MKFFLLYTHITHIGITFNSHLFTHFDTKLKTNNMHTNFKFLILVQNVNLRQSTLSQKDNLYDKALCSCQL